MSAIQEPFAEASFDWTAHSRALQDSCYTLKKKLRKCKTGVVSASLETFFAEHKFLQKGLVKKVLTASPGSVPRAFLKELFASQVLLEQATSKNPSLQLERNERLISDPTKLTAAIEPKGETRKDMYFEWELNLSLLQNIYHMTSDPKTQELLRFLIINYLAKAAYLNIGSGVGMDKAACEKQYTDLLQVGALTMQSLYHRGNCELISSLLNVSKIAGLQNEGSSSFYLLDTMDIEPFYALGFIPCPSIKASEELRDVFVKQFSAHLSHGFEAMWERPMLLDISSEIGQSLVTNQEASAQAALCAQLKLLKIRLQETLTQAATKILTLNPELELSPQEIKTHLINNLAIVSTAQISEFMAVLSTYPSFFNKEDFPSSPIFKDQFERLKHLDDKFIEWISHTGLCIGGVKFRQSLAHQIKDLSGISEISCGAITKYLVPGSAENIYYDSLAQFIETNAYTSLARLATQESSAQQLYALATAKMIETLFSKISPMSWEKKHRDPALKELIQTTLYRLNLDIGLALLYQKDFRKFSQAIDRIHSHLTTLLVLFEPFDPLQFDHLYPRYLSPSLPADFTPCVGIAKAAMNVFAGINAYVLHKNPDAVRVVGRHSYYEQSALLGPSSPSLDQVLQDPSIKKVDLYVAEFYHNIDIDPQHTHYEKEDVIKDIQRIFREKPDTDCLTVAIDNTLDFTQSENVGRLFAALKQEILEGKLNVIVFRSGQKFDMMGLDNYFGSPFYIVNNADPKWKAFQALKTASTHHTDPLSLQFFTWITQTDPSLIDAYKNYIFTNTRSILSLVPSSLLPGQGKDISISTFAEDVKTPFFEILIEGDDQHELRRWVQQRFMEIFTKKDRLVFARGSFGFPHPNITWIEPKMRINPGIDASDIPLYEQFFKDLEEHLVTLSTPT
jgi:hypothetical protein